VLPEQKPKPQPFDAIKIILAIVLGLAAIYSEVWTSDIIVSFHIW